MLCRPFQLTLPEINSKFPFGFAVSVDQYTRRRNR